MPAVTASFAEQGRDKGAFTRDRKIESAVTVLLDFGKKPVSLRVSQVDGRLLFDEQFCVRSALTSTDFEMDFHDYLTGKSAICANSGLLVGG